MFEKTPTNIRVYPHHVCWPQLQKIMGGFPIALDLRDENNQLLTQMILDLDGSVTDIRTLIVYGSPSQLRAVYIGHDTDTYEFLYYQNQSLRSLGVQP